VIENCMMMESSFTLLIAFEALLSSEVFWAQCTFSRSVSNELFVFVVSLFRPDPRTSKLRFLFESVSWED
jgi:hypothetical protein